MADTTIYLNHDYYFDHHYDSTVLPIGTRLEVIENDKHNDLNRYARTPTHIMKVIKLPPPKSVPGKVRIEAPAGIEVEVVRREPCFLRIARAVGEALKP